jgi:hypothetical protein
MNFEGGPSSHYLSNQKMAILRFLITWDYLSNGGSTLFLCSLKTEGYKFVVLEMLSLFIYFINFTNLINFINLKNLINFTNLMNPTNQTAIAFSYMLSRNKECCRV